MARGHSLNLSGDAKLVPLSVVDGSEYGEK